MLLNEYITNLYNKYSADPVSLRDLIREKKYNYHRVGAALFGKLISTIIDYAESIENADERLRFKSAVRDEAEARKESLISEFMEMAINRHSAEMKEEAEAATQQIYNKYFGDQNKSLNTLKTLVKDYLPINNGEAKWAIATFAHDIYSELSKAFVILDISKYSNEIARFIEQTFDYFDQRVKRDLTELYNEWIAAPAESTSLPELTHVRENTASAQSGWLLKNQEPISTRIQMTHNLSKLAQDPIAPAHIVKHDFLHQINVTYVTAPTKDPRTKRRVLDPRTGKASTPYYVFVRVDKIPINVIPGEASSPQIELFRYKMPARSSAEAQQLARDKIKELQGMLPNIKTGKPTYQTLPYPFGLLSTPELDAPDKPATPTFASLDRPLTLTAEDYMSTQNISSIYDKTRALEDAIYKIREKGGRLDSWLESRISQANRNLTEVHNHVVYGSKRQAMVPELLSLAHKLEVLGRPKEAQKLDLIAAELTRTARKDIIPGGLADKSDMEDFNPEQLCRGLKVELEHTSDPKIALEITMDHLMEDKKYYVKLEKMESAGKTSKASSFFLRPL